MDGKEFRDSSGRQKDNTSDSVDRISSLPDSILGVILSFIPTKNAVTTSILSKSWRFVWMKVHNLDFFYDGFLKEHDEDIRFIQFVTRVLNLHDDESLNKFSLVWIRWCISSYVTSWISTAVKRDVHELYLCLKTLHRQFEPPLAVFNCASLRSLELNGSIYVSASIAVCLPGLESLKLVSVHFETDDAFEKFISGSPVLKNLWLDICSNDEDMNGFTYTISSTSLRRLELLFFMPDCSLKLEASSLEYFKLSGCMPKICWLKSLCCLVEVDFEIFLLKKELSQPRICKSIIEAVRAFDYAKSLFLSTDVMQVLSYGTINFSTDFKRLVKLETSIKCFDCPPLRDFIQNSDSLEALIIYQHSNWLGESHHYGHLKWTTKAEVPRCLLKSLKKVVFNGYNGSREEQAMVRYALKHGSVLEVMKISSGSDILSSTKSKLVQEICKFPRKSPACEVIFSRKKASYQKEDECFWVDISQQGGKC